jgi:heme/copper-type cytochrome/quinol oxidase subunit 3
MRSRVVTNLRALPVHATGSASVTWWGTAGFMVLEGAGFALAIGAYLYLALNAPQWPLASPLPDLGPGTAITGVLLASAVPNVLLGRWAKARDLRKVRVGIVLMTLVGLVPLITRIFEFPAMHVWWDTDAYGSIVWFILGLHTTHLLTDVADTAVLAALMLTRHGRNKKRFGDVVDNANYWNFVVLSWLPIYLVLYWYARI